jgi:folate-binding protein YgfZ
VSGVIQRIDCGRPALLEFRGPDAVRFLNGQLTQDARLLAGGKISLPSCVTDAKGRMQFRVWLTESPDGALWVEGPAERADELEARLTRYLIADDVEVRALTGEWLLVHLTGITADAPPGVVTRENARFGVPGTDWWIPSGVEIRPPDGFPELTGEALEAFRIANGVPLWGSELSEGLLPPEAGLDATDISYQKGCYIGQEVISRVKSAGKVNKRLARLLIDAGLPAAGLRLVDAAGADAGALTSVSPLVSGNGRPALAYLKRGVGEVFVEDAMGRLHPARMI